MVLYCNTIVRLSSCLINQILYLLIKLGSLHELFDSEVHTISPVVSWIGWDVDALGIGIGKAQIGIGGKPILKREDAEHGRTGEVVADYLRGNIWCERVGGFALMPK